MKGELELIVAGAPVRAVVHESRRSRRLRLVVRPGHPVEVRTPQRTSRATVLRFVADHMDWLAERLADAGRVQARSTLLGLPDAPHNVDPEALERWYRRRARVEIEEATARHAARLGLSFERLAVRDQRTRWGSCSARRTLSFNWRLVLAPAEVLEYVVVHELFHLCEANHSPRFWALLDADRPGWRAEAHWLRDHGDELLAYVPVRL